MNRLVWSRVARYLLIGIVITFGIAWWSEHQLALFTGLSKQIATSATGASWEASLLSCGNSCRGVVSRAVMQQPSQLKSSVVQGPYWSRIRKPPTTFQIESYEIMLEDARGWPMPALLARHLSDTTFSHWQTEWGIQLSTDQGKWGAPRALPLKPIFRGFIIDVLFWAAITWFAVQQFVTIRTRWRRANGRCANCAHVLLPAQETCPECGVRKLTKSL